MCYRNLTSIQAPDEYNVITNVKEMTANEKQVWQLKSYQLKKLKCSFNSHPLGGEVRIKESERNYLVLNILIKLLSRIENFTFSRVLFTKGFGFYNFVRAQSSSNLS